MKKYGLTLLILISLSFHSSAYAGEVCQSLTAYGQFGNILRSACVAHVNYCQTYAKDQNCLDRMLSTKATQNVRERSALIRNSNLKLELANEVFRTLTLNSQTYKSNTTENHNSDNTSSHKTSLSDTDIHEYETKLNLLDGYSRHTSPEIQEFILDIKNKLQAHWMAEFYHAWSVWLGKNEDLQFKAGLPLALLSGQLAIHNIRDSALFTKFLQQSLPGKIFSLSSFALRVTTPYVTLEAVKSLNPNPLLMPLSPAHFIRFNFEDFLNDKLESLAKIQERAQEHDQIRTGISVAAAFLIGDVQMKALRVFPNWLPTWAEKVFKWGATEAPHASKWNPKNLIRLTPQSFIAGVAVDSTVAQGLRSYTDHQIHSQITDILKDNVVNPDLPRKLMQLLTEVDLYLTQDNRDQFYATKNFIISLQYAIDNKLELASYLDEYFFDNQSHLKLSGADMIRHLSCNSMRSREYNLVGRREIRLLPEKYLERKLTLVSSLRKQVELLQTILSESSQNKNPSLAFILENKIKQLKMEANVVSNEPHLAQSKRLTDSLYQNWFLPVSEHFNNKKTSFVIIKRTETNQNYENLQYCSF